jgi:ADP-ribose pyrophosphatase YjhB (NUDIX family)
MTWRDASGRTLADYPRPSLAVDVVLLTVRTDDEGDRQLCVLLHQREEGPDDGQWSLPGSFVREGERLVGAVQRTVADKLSLRTRAPRQLAVFDDPDRDSRGHVVSVAHVDLLPEEELLGQDGSRWTLAPVDGTRLRLPGRQRRLPFDHDLVVGAALDWARSRYERRPDPSRLLHEPFTLRELRRLHEAVLGRELFKDTFRRRMEPQLVLTDQKSSGVRGPRAAMYRRPS